MKKLPCVSEDVVVHGMLNRPAKVSSLRWDDTFFDWIIELDWGEHGKSRVKLHDEDKIWYRLSNKN